MPDPREGAVTAGETRTFLGTRYRRITNAWANREQSSRYRDTATVALQCGHPVELAATSMASR
jgi:hypothetical protein